MDTTEADGPETNIAHDPEIAALIAAESLPKNRIQVVPDLRGADPLVIATRESLSKQQPDEYGRVWRRHDFSDPCFQVSVSKANVHRALLLLLTLLRALRSRGYSITSANDNKRSPLVDVLGHKFAVSIWEPSKRTKRELTKQEQEELKKWRWSSIRDYEYVPTGNLELHVDRDTYWSKGKLTDTKRLRLEDRLNEFIAIMFQIVDNERIRAKKEQLEAAEAEKRRLRAVEQEMTRRTESVRVDRLRKSVPKWENAQRIKDYVTAIRNEALRRFGSIDDTSEIGQWLKWADDYLAGIDPLSSRRDLPTFALAPEELDQLRQECDGDWISWSESFRPRQPR